MPASRTAEFLLFPPGRRNILVPTVPYAATATAMSMYTACKPFPLAAQHLLWASALLTRTSRWVPGPRTGWVPPMSAEDFASLSDAWAAAMGNHVEALAVYQRIQAERPSLTVLVCAGTRSMLVRVRTDAGSLARERAVSAAAVTLRPRTFRVPELHASGQVGAWSWVGYEVISTRPHRPVRVLHGGLTDEIAELVGRVVAAPAGTPAHWRPAHGDLSCWNLRRARSRRWLIDWEDCGWLPPGADEVYFRAVWAALRPGPVRTLRVPAAHDEAVAYWSRVVRERDVHNTDPALNRRLQVLLTGG